MGSVSSSLVTVELDRGPVLEPQNPSKGRRLEDSHDTLRVVGGYIQFPTISGAPPTADCLSDWQAGRVVVSTDTGNLYICKGATGWGVK